MKINALLLAGAAFFVATGAQAQNLVTNGDFATGDFSGFTLFGNTGYTFVNSNIAYFGAIGSSGGISQMLTTVAGTPYLFSFDLGNSGNGFDSYDI